MAQDPPENASGTPRSLLFYERAMPVSLDRHRGWSIDPGVGFAFSRHTNAVPLTTVEFSRAAGEYSIVFAAEGETVLPVAVLGLEDRQNLFIDEAGGWEGRYVPAFVRRYPFVFATRDEGRNLTVCIDEAFAGCNQEGKGESLFDDEGRTTPYLERVVAFLREYQAQYERTRSLCRRLRELDLLEPMQANVAMHSGRRLSLTGFLVVGRKRIAGLDDATLLELARGDGLELVHLHLQSLTNFAPMVDRLAARSPPA